MSALAVAVVMSVLLWWAGTRIKSPEQIAAEAGPPPATSITEEVQYLRLENTVIARGTVRAGGRTVIDVNTPIGAQRLVITGTPQKVGGVVEEGAILLEVSGRPMFALAGKFPMYRDLAPGDLGKDVTQLQEALVRLGFFVGVTGTFDSVTQDAVRRLYKGLGYDPVPAGIAEAEDGKVDNPHTNRSGIRGAKDAILAPISELTFVPHLPAQVIGLSVRVGDQPEPGKEALMIATGGLSVVCRLTPSETEGLSVGTSALVESEGLGLRFKAKVASIDKALSTDPGSGAQGYLVSLKPARTLATRLTGQDVRVSIRVKFGRNRVLAVPVSAVRTGVDGSSYVTKSTSAGEQGFPVRLGASGNGLVEVRPLGPGLVPGDHVVVG